MHTCPWNRIVKKKRVNVSTSFSWKSSYAATNPFKEHVGYFVDNLWINSNFVIFGAEDLFSITKLAKYAYINSYSRLIKTLSKTI